MAVTVTGFSKFTSIATVCAPVAPVAPLTTIWLDGIWVPGVAENPASGSCPTVSVTSPGFAARVIVAPV